jgi:hypothetical protein
MANALTGFIVDHVMKRLGAQAHEAGDVILPLEVQSLFGQDGELDLQRQDLAIDQHTVAIENNSGNQRQAKPPYGS